MNHMTVTAAALAGTGKGMLARASRRVTVR